ncbi:MAG TPA: DUF1573 domain-containing protein [Candidatus Bathyarchaeia archaeon]|nr:DUF1573 domain-containing protein [Candidatus Bathyarchaeia archaeon]
MVRWRVALFWAGCLLIVAGSCWAWAEPKLETGPRTVDFGARLNYREVECRFTLSNAGTGPLEVSIKKASCGCTSQMLSGETVAPGQSAELLLTHKAKKGKTRTGMQSFSVELATNDPENAEVALTARVKLVDQVYVEPESVELPDEMDAQPLRVFCMDDGGMPEVLSVEPAVASVAVEKVGVEKQERQTVHAYRVKRVPSVPRGEPFSIVVRTSSARVPVIEVPVKVSAALVLDAKPGRVLFGVVKAGSAIEKCVALTAKDEAVNVATCTSSEGAITPVLIKGDGAGEWNLAVKLTAPPVTEIGTIKADLVLRDDTGRWLHTIPVVATVAP